METRHRLGRVNGGFYFVDDPIFAPNRTSSFVLYQSPRFIAPLMNGSCLPYRFVKMRSWSVKPPCVSGGAVSRSRASSSSRWTLATSPASEPTKTRLKTSTDDRRMIERRCARPIVEQTCCRSLPVALFDSSFPSARSFELCRLQSDPIVQIRKMCLRFRATHTKGERVTLW